MNRVTRTSVSSRSLSEKSAFPIDNQIPKESIMIKGSHSDDSDGTMIINGEKGSFKVNRHNLRERLVALKSQVSVPIKTLSGAYASNFSSVVEVMKLLHNSPALYNIILADIQSIFSDIGPTVPGTVGSFFMGCFNNDSFSGPMGCNPKCASSLAPPDGTPGFSSCSDLVLIYEDGFFSALNTLHTPKAYIYIKDSTFNGFTSENIKQLSSVGVQQAVLIYGNDDGSYRELTDPIPIQSLPVSTGSTLTASSSDDSSTSTAAAIIFGIILALLIIALIYFATKN